MALESSTLVLRNFVCTTPGFLPCTVSGSSSGTAPDITLSGNYGIANLMSQGGSAISNLAGRSLQLRNGAGLCCNPQAQCLIMPQSNAPYCYNATITQFLFEDGSNGLYATGDYYDAQQNVEYNFYTGDYIFANGTTGNFYSERNEVPPNTATITRPSALASPTLILPAAFPTPSSLAVPAAQPASSVASHPSAASVQNSVGSQLLLLTTALTVLFNILSRD